MVVDTNGGELFCSNCGFVVKEKIEETGPNGGHSPRRRRTTARGEAYRPR